MAGARFDIQFAGELMAGAHADEVRTRLQRRFGLSDETAARLFDGRPLTIKRGVDTATASRFREVFRQAGALIRVVPAASGHPPPPPTTDTGVDVGRASTDAPSTLAGELRLAPAGEAQPLEARSAVVPRIIDTDHLSLVPGHDWTLEDCAPTPLPVALPDIRHLRMVLPRERTRDEGRGSPGSRNTGRP